MHQTLSDEIHRLHQRAAHHDQRAAEIALIGAEDDLPLTSTQRSALFWLRTKAFGCRAGAYRVAHGLAR